jgi:HECT-like Ubiquitin-conjugating enzyme (E2)-binding/MYND finger
MERPTKCQVCRKQCRLLRCQKCQAAWYCSVSCQRHDWKAQHRRSCPSTRVVAAWEELSQILSTASLDQVQQDYRVATDTVKSLLKVEDKKVEAVTTISKTESKPPILPTVASQTPLVAQRNKQTQESIAEAISGSESKFNVSNNDSPLFWKFYIEDMPQLHCYQILLRPVDPQPIHLGWLKLSLAPSSSKALVTIMYGHEQPLRLELPRRLAETSPRVYLVDDDQAVSMRLIYATDDELSDRDDWIAPQLLAPSEASKLACGYCHQLLLNSKENASAIQRVLPLPSGRWDEMQDYLVCYEGQATFDFSSASTYGQEKTLLEDETVLVAHTQDVGTAACVVAVSGYGEDARDDDCDNSSPLTAAAGLSEKDPTALVRGSRPWREAVGGATLTCSLCVSSLGFAPVDMPDTYRLLKHQLVLLKQDGPVTRMQTVSSFLVHEMIRFAETKAIFTFVVSDDSMVGHKRLLFLRLVSWDTTAASSSEAGREQDNVYQIPKWKRRSKILYEEAADAEYTGGSLWMWTTQDWCCPPPGGSKEEKAEPPTVDNRPTETQSASVVRLCLPTQEWKRLRAELQETSQFYAKEVINATITAKLGRSATSHEEIGLATIPI